MITQALQMQKENFNWLSSLEHYSRENAVQKNQLAIVLEKKMTSLRLEEAEYFQNEFLKKDEIISILRHDISSQEQMLFSECREEGNKIKEDLLKRQERLRDNMDFLTWEFNSLKEAFQNYLLLGE